MAQKIFLIEDETAIADSVEYSLENEGFEVMTAADGVAGLTAARTAFPDLIILDLMLPRLSGLDVCRTVRKESSVPIIILTAKTDEVERVVGLELGADDYVTKPFSVRELTARVRAVLRRAKNSAQAQNEMQLLKAGNVSIDLARRRVTVGEKPVHLPLKQFELLKTLMSYQDKVLTREYLFQNVWDSDANYDTGTLDVHVRWLREKIEKDPSRPRYIRTVRGVGYKFVAEADNKQN
ncbi:MAG: response regulator transcription factor [Armatimonadetes bacterium]|nr:response regulator transcription factor [Armatimonadota bacterium]